VFWLRKQTDNLDYVLGTYVSLLLLVTSRVWELAEAHPVKPVAAMIQNGTPVGEKVYTSYPYGRPSLNFYIAIAKSSRLLPVNSNITGSRTLNPISCLINLP